MLILASAHFSNQNITACPTTRNVMDKPTSCPVQPFFRNCTKQRYSDISCN